MVVVALALSLLTAASPGPKRQQPSTPAAEAAAVRPAFRWELPNKLIRDIKVPETFHANGVPTRFHVVTAELSWQEVYAHFHRSFRRQRLYVAPRKDQMELNGQVMLTGFDPDRKISYSVILQPHDDGATTIIMGEAYLGQAAPPMAPDFAPMFPGAENVFVTHQEGASTVAYTVDARPEDIARFYRETLTSAGYSKAADGSYQKAGRALSFSANTHLSGTGSAVNVVSRQVGGEGGPAAP